MKDEIIKTLKTLKRKEEIIIKEECLLKLKMKEEKEILLKLKIREKIEILLNKIFKI